MEKRELVVIGAGPAGLTAAIYGRRAGLDVLLLEKGVAGGQINTTEEIENWPGVEHASGPELSEMFRKHAEKFKTEFREVDVSKVELRGESKIVTTNKGEIEAEAVIIATGAYFRRLGCEGEAEHIGQGVSYCAVCDGAFFEDEEIAVVGGGNTAVEEAVYLTNFASKVFIIHRRDEFRADRAAIEHALSNPKIEPVWNTVVEKIEGDGMVENLVIKNVKTGEVSDLPVAGVFMFVGQLPHDECVKGLVDAARGGWILTDDNMETSVEGIFAAGDVRDKGLRQVVTAASDGAIAAMSASAYINEQLHLRSVLFEPERVVALFYSSIDQEQVRLSDEVDTLTKEKGKKVALIDGYRNKRMADKLGLEKLPALVEIVSGQIVKKSPITAAADVLPLL
ncbi:MAG: thioredoxin-disulfide reductase [Synergistaceae bacterium]|nr:thioredoxin-disulfide reductase [Synergistota bacterium]NLM72062.1 thioredoxin-disulfide reductase [Synergistaceae bacterium]